VEQRGQKLLVIYGALMLALLLFAAKREWLQSQLAGWSPEQHAELEDVLTKLSRAVPGEDFDRQLAAR
jgi:hypothetical protein